MNLIKQSGTPGTPTILAIIDGSESYDLIEQSLAPLLEQINAAIDYGKVGEKPVTILLGADMKFLQIISGLNGSIITQSCVWCKVSKDEFSNTSRPWDFYSSVEMNRTFQNMSQDALQSKNGMTKGVPLMKLDSENVVLDELHLMLRVCDILLRNLIFEVKDTDAELNFNGTGRDLIGPNLKSLCQCINDCGVTFHLWEAKDPVTREGSGKLDWTSLQGPDMKKLLSSLPAKLEVSELMFPETKNKVLNLWRGFHALHTMLCNEPVGTTWPSQTHHIDCFEKARSWLDEFMSIGNKRKGYRKLNVTPYMHAMVYHVPTVIKDHGPLSRFSGQGVEKLNGTVKKVTLSKCNRADSTNRCPACHKESRTFGKSELCKAKEALHKGGSKVLGFY
jgi:hypothetical protein